MNVLGDRPAGQAAPLEAHDIVAAAFRSCRELNPLARSGVRERAEPRGGDQLTPRAREIVNAARELLEEEGIDALSMRRIGQRLGIRAPSIYKHLPDKDALEAAIISSGFQEQAARFEAALEHTDDPLGALARAYRDFGREHPHLYRLMTDRALNREPLVPGAEERAALPLYKATGENMDLARAAWAFGHGMTILELNNRFPPDADLDAAWEHGIAAFRADATTRKRDEQPA
jgi:AcrR family transcriptional regulator